MKKKILAMLLALSMLLSFSAILTSCATTDPGDQSGDQSGDQGGNTGADSSAVASYVNIDINPEISLTVSEGGVVLTAVGENEDGQVLLYGEEGIIGQSFDDAMDKILDLASDLGYLSEDNKVIEAIVSSVDDSKSEDLLSKINGKVSAKAADLGISFKVDTDGAYSLLRELEALKAENPENSKIAALTVSDYKLALKASENGEITFEAAIELDREALISRIDSAASKIEEYSTKAFRKAREAAMAIYDSALETALSGVYSAYFTKTNNYLMLPTAALYQSYSTAAFGIGSIADAIELLEEMGEYELDEGEVADILSALGLDALVVEDMKNSEGKLTVESVEDYIDVYLKNLPESAELEALEEEVDDLLDALESTAEEGISKLATTFSAEIEAVISALETAVSAIRSYVPAGSLDAFDKAILDVNAMIESGKITSDALDDIAEELADAAEELSVTIEGALEEANIAEIEALKAEIIEGLATMRSEVEAQLDKAEADAKAALAKIKSDRLAAKSE